MSEENINTNEPTEIRDDLGFGSDAPEVANKNLTGLIKSRGYGELSLDPGGPDTGALKYAKGEWIKYFYLRAGSSLRMIEIMFTSGKPGNEKDIKEYRVQSLLANILFNNRG